jgi:DNA-binding LacI/PurR family transcriptional regulator
VVFISARDESTALEKLKLAGIPVVVIDRVPQSYHGPAVVLDNARAGRLAAEHLLALGHTRFAHIGGPESVHIARERLFGFRSVLPDASVRHLAIEPAKGWRVEDGYAALQRLLTWHTDFTALFCAGDQLAIGAMRALREVGRGIPDEVSVVGVDDIDLASFLCPPLTTVSQSIGEMAAVGVRLLLTMLEGQELAQPRIVIEPALVLRQSSAPPPRA